MHAQQALEIANTYNQQQREEHVLNILKSIQQAAAQGCYELEPVWLEQHQKDKLHELGYKLYSCSPFTIISW